MRKPLSKLKHVLRKCNGVSQKKTVYCKMDVLVKTVYCKVMTIENKMSVPGGVDLPADLPLDLPGLPGHLGVVITKVFSYYI